MSLINQALQALDIASDFPRNNAHYEHNGHPVPRVTEILSRMIHKDTLMYWANSLGFKGLRYKEVLEKAADIGTEAHAAIEKFLKEKYETNSNIPFKGFMMWYKYLTDIGMSVTPIYIEHQLTCEYFGGTMDALLKIDNKIYLVDFKTSNHVTFNYFLQLAAYRYMLKLRGIEIDGVIVLQLDKEVPGFNEYLLEFSIVEHLDFINHCELTFLSLVYAFFNIELTERMYCTVFKEGKK